MLDKNKSRLRSQDELNKLITRAYSIASHAHRDQFRKDGSAYINHIYAVTDILNEEYFKLIPQSAECRLIWGPLKPYVIMGAILHDTVEDTSVTIEYLRSEGFTELVLDMIKDVTKREGEGYFDFIMRIHCSGNPGSKAIKLADLCHNLSDLPEGAQRAKYELSQYILNWFNN